MICDKCGVGKMAVVDTREKDTIVYRKRVCKNCKHTMYTEELEAIDKHFVISTMSEIINRRLKKNDNN